MPDFGCAQVLAVARANVARGVVERADPRRIKRFRGSAAQSHGCGAIRKEASLPAKCWIVQFPKSEFAVMLEMPGGSAGAAAFCGRNRAMSRLTTFPHADRAGNQTRVGARAWKKRRVHNSKFPMDGPNVKIPQESGLARSVIGTSLICLSFMPTTNLPGTAWHRPCCLRFRIHGRSNSTHMREHEWCQSLRS